ncbi:Rv1355c family protein [Pedobacter foliorum]|uniref:Rv1355c family protein n=1 Tax=Pedobacter foliorum TaxID=2739058 RepID=UPI001563E15D|nr:Rv1355c family protein [Pedobacter foliorum]NRF41263.1 Rv1355c family protein [Pedobacter foliorum]
MHLNNETSKFIKDSISRSQQHKDTYKPVFYRINNPEEEVKLNNLLKEKPYIQIFDTINNQLKDLVKGLSPSVMYNENTLNEAIQKHLQDQDIFRYGVWAYYPWLEKLVHILDEEEYILVRTNRNKHKITQEEQDLLGQKKIGVIGLSVGQSVSLTLAIERGCGELRIADFDVLDLTNLNRIRSGIQNVDLKKTVIVAREIAELDPYLKVVCFDDGITESNIDRFLSENGQLDLLIDECDSFDIKISARKKAKELGIPVLMEGSDRCTIDIERFDLEPERPVLHGFVEHMDMSVYKSLKTMDERIPYIAPVTGIETLSPRMKASAIEIMTTISTWPQLASAVTYGGGITADISRRIMLGDLKVSGRFFIDIDELIADKKEDTEKSDKIIEPKWSVSEIETYIQSNNLNGSEGESIAADVIENLVKSANKAPSGGNNQPWNWHYLNSTLHLFMDKSVAGAYLDPDYISSYISLGAAIENLLLEASINNLDVEWKFTPEYLPNHIALFRFKTGHIATEQNKKLASQISSRHTNRKNGIPTDVNQEDLLHLQQLTETIEGVSLQWLSDDEQKKTLGEISGSTDLLRIFTPEAHQDFISKEMRWTQEEIENSADGIGINTLDLSNNDQIGLRLIKDERAVTFLNKINGGSAFKKMSVRQFLSANSIGLITLPEASSMNYLKGGMAAEKLWLAAADLGYQVHPVNVPIIFFYKQNFQKENDLSLANNRHILQLHQKFKELFNITDNIAEIFLFRLFKAEKSERRTIRKPILKTLSFGNE